MRRTLLFGLLLLLAGCRADAPAAGEAPLTRCSEPRRPMCTREYRPVCGERSDGSHATYANACEACADPRVVGHRPQPCPED